MNRSEHLLLCLAEECCEVGQRVSKALRFGLNEIQRNQPFNNAERIAEEFRDLCAVAHILQREGLLDQCFPNSIEIAAKQAKIERYMQISRDHGVLSGTGEAK